MGLWWKKVKMLPEGKGLTLDGSELSFPKKVPLLWRFTNPWVVLKVGNYRPYRLYYDDGVERRLYKRVLYTPYIAVRLGPTPICFLAIGTVQGSERALTRVEEEVLPPHLDDTVITYV